MESHLAPLQRKVHVLLVDGLSDAYMQIEDTSKEAEEDGTLILYLVIYLALISFIFLVSVVITVVMMRNTAGMCRERYIASSRNFYGDSNFSNTLLDITGTGTLSQPYRYEVCLTNGPGNSDFKFFQPLGSPLPVENGNVEVNPKTSLETQTNSNMLDGKDPVRG
ncbi:unnamed protein product, partial [Eretmochelys imbricata]